MLNLNDTEEILAILIAVAIVLGFVYSTYREIQSTISEEKGKYREKKEKTFFQQLLGSALEPWFLHVWLFNAHEVSSDMVFYDIVHLIGPFVDTFPTQIWCLYTSPDEYEMRGSELSTVTKWAMPFSIE